MKEAGKLEISRPRVATKVLLAVTTTTVVQKQWERLQRKTKDSGNNDVTWRSYRDRTSSCGRGSSSGGVNDGVCRSGYNSHDDGSLDDDVPL